MKHIALADSLGVLILTATAALPLGCVKTPAQAVDLQPLIAVAGNYALLESGTRNPTPAPSPPAPGPIGCESGCRCNGTGREPTGDGLSTVPCRCDDTCACKKKKEPTPCQNGKCPPPTRPTGR